MYRNQEQQAGGSPAQSGMRYSKSIEAINGDIANKIKELRTELNVSAAELAARIGCDPMQVFRMETGTVHVKAAMLVLIARALEKPLIELFPER